MAEIDTILDNQEVTAQILNDIAIDLGYTSFNGFGENKFGADELNGITGDLVSPGILSSDNKCEPYISGGKVYINTGTIVFASGAKKKITELVELDLITNSYIYALNDSAHNVCKIVVSETAPADDDFVTLCEISADGTLIDRRVIAKAKVELPTEGNSYVFTDEITASNAVEYNEKTFSIPIEGVTKIFINAGHSPRIRIEYDLKTQTFSGYDIVESYDIQLNKARMKIFGNDSGSGTQLAYIKIISQDEKKVTFGYTTTNVENNKDVTISLNFYVFGGVER